MPEIPECPFSGIDLSLGKPMPYSTPKSPISSGHDRSSGKLDLIELYRLYNDRSDYNSLMQRLEKFQVFANADSTTGQLRILIHPVATITAANGWLLDMNRLFLFLPMRSKSYKIALFSALFDQNRDESFYRLIEAPYLEFISKTSYKIVKTGIIKTEVQISPSSSPQVSFSVNPAPAPLTTIQVNPIVSNSRGQTTFLKPDFSSDLVKQLQEITDRIEDLENEKLRTKEENQKLREEINSLREESLNSRNKFQEKINFLENKIKALENKTDQDLTEKLSQEIIEKQIVKGTTTVGSNSVVNPEETNNDREDHEQTTSTEDSYLTEEEQMICDYYNNFNQLFAYDVQTVQEAKESISEGRIQSSLGAILEVNSDGKYWVFQTSSSIFLVPDRNISLNQYKMQTVRKLFDHNPEAASYRNFWLRKPAKLEVSGNDRWRVIEKGYLEFILE